MPRTKRTRIDYMPGPAALQALGIAAGLLPTHRPQELLDRLVIVGAAALAADHWRPPAMYGRRRDRWTLPEELAALVPGESG